MTPPALTPAAMLRTRAAEQPEGVVFRHLTDDGATSLDVTYAALYQRALVVAAHLTELGLRQRPVLLVYTAGPDFVAAFYGAMLAGAIAVPVPVPQFASHYERLERVAVDCEPGALLTTGALMSSLATRVDAGAFARCCPWVATDALAGGAREPALVGGDSVALLQYTSGSTAEPRGVVITHDNLASNAATIVEDLPVPHAPGVSWLPHFHDMGLIAGVVTPIYRDAPSILMAPLAFLQRPLRWLEAITRHGARTSGAPNFAYGLCVRAAATADLSGLDLSSWEVAYVGAEPVRPTTLAAFTETFAPYGFRADAFTPCYGMAEATLLVTSKRKTTAPVVHAVSRAALERGQVVSSSDADALRLVGCGVAVADTDVLIVDPQQRVEVARGGVGEVWVRGPQVARGYWRRHDDDPFNAVLAGSGAGPFLRTGDLAFMADDGELVFVDRLKDLVIVNGQNYACHDLELTAGTSHPLLSPDACIACGTDSGDQPRITVIAELPVTAVAAADEVARAIRAAVHTRHGVPIHTVAFVAPRKLSRTTSGKLQRRLTATRLIAGELRVLAHRGDPLPRHIPAEAAGYPR